MTVSGTLRVALAAAIGVMGLAVGASEPASFIERVEQSQGIMPRGAGTEHVTESAAATPSSYGEPASFIARVEKSQGIEARGIESRGTEASAGVVATRSSYGEPASFIARVEKSQGIMPAMLEREDQLMPEQIRLVQRALNDKGHPTPVSGKFDEMTRSALMSFQRSRSLPVSGSLDSRTVDALGFDPTEVTPVRGASDDKR